MDVRKKSILGKMSEALVVAREYLNTYRMLNEERSGISSVQAIMQLSKAADATFDAWPEQMKKFEALRTEYERKPVVDPREAPR